MARLGTLVFAGALLLGAPAALRAQPSGAGGANPQKKPDVQARVQTDFVAVPASAARGGQIIGLVLLALLVSTALGVLFYFVPTAVAILRGHPKIGPIILVNLLLGWTLAGWAVALAWAISPREPESDRRDEH